MTAATGTDVRRRSTKAGAARPRRWSRPRTRRRLYGALAVAVAVLWAFPVYWMVNSAFLPGNRIRSTKPTFFPVPGTLDNFQRVFENGGFLSALRISLTVTLLTVAVTLIVAFLAALAISRFRFRSRKAFIVTILFVQMIPAEGLFISQFKMLDGWNLLNSIVGLGLLYVAAVVPFTIWLLRGFVDGLPIELEEAAMVDGCSRTQAFVRVTFPLLAPGLVASGIFAFMLAWNEFTLALIVMTRPENQTLPVWLKTFTEANRATDWGGIMAGSTLLAIPVVIFFLFIQHRMTAGLVSGAVKG
ncbi:MAG TPA: carbohydrate ABC transporter permease [Jiangellaceae bacterium]|nr:carbohydrate ABC transporter permease [Jiangellaceae bacterium]